MQQPSKILVRAPNWIGDQVMAFEFYSGLRQLYPNAELTLFLSNRLRGLTPPGIFSSVIEFGPGTVRSWKGLWKTALQLRKEEFDLAIGLPASVSSAFLFCLAGIPARVGFAEPGAESFLTTSIRWQGRASKKHKAEIYLDILDLLSHGFTPTPPHSKLASHSTKKKIVLAPEASISLREWPYFRDLVLWLREAYPDFSLELVGTKSGALWESFSKREGVILENQIGKTDLLSLLESLKSAALVIANDSGVAHLAASLAGVPTLVLMGPGDPSYIAPRGKRVVLARQPVPCSPCEKPYCRATFGYQVCLRELSLPLVKPLIQELLTVSSPSP